MKSIKISKLIAVVLTTVMVFMAIQAAEAQTGDRQAITVEQIDQRIRDYLLNNPEVLVQSIQKWQAQQKQVELAQVSQVIEARQDEIFNDPDAPIGGNPEGDITVVEFMDYNCAYCRKVAPAVIQLTKGDANVRLLFKEFPILGPGSQFASRAALASKQQGLYRVFHHALMQFDQRLEEPQVLAIAERVGLDIERLKEDLKAPEIQAMIDRNFKLAQALAINGTPGFVIGKEIVRGATSLDNLQRLVAQARQTD